MKKLFIDILSSFIKNPSKKKLIRNILTNKIDTKNNNNNLNNILDITAKINQIANDTANLKHFINRIVERKLSVAELHKKTFTPFKNKHQNQEIVVIGTGPTAKLYTPLKDAIHLGVNHSFLLENIKLDYFFIQDFSERKDMIKDINNLKSIYSLALLKTGQLVSAGFGSAISIWQKETFELIEAKDLNAPFLLGHFVPNDNKLPIPFHSFGQSYPDVRFWKN